MPLDRLFKNGSTSRTGCLERKRLHFCYLLEEFLASQNHKLWLPGEIMPKVSLGQRLMSWGEQLAPTGKYWGLKK